MLVFLIIEYALVFLNISLKLISEDFPEVKIPSILIVTILSSTSFSLSDNSLSISEGCLLPASMNMEITSFSFICLCSILLFVTSTIKNPPCFNSYNSLKLLGNNGPG